MGHNPKSNYCPADDSRQADKRNHRMPSEHLSSQSQTRPSLGHHRSTNSVHASSYNWNEPVSNTSSSDAIKIPSAKPSNASLNSLAQRRIAGFRSLTDPRPAMSKALIRVVMVSVRV